MTAWRRAQLKHLSEVPITNGLGEAATHNDPDWPRYIRTTDIAGTRTLREETFASLPKDVAAKASVRRGDLLMSAAGTVGKTFLYCSDAPACYAGYLVRFRPRANVDPRFIAYWTETPLFMDQIEMGKVTSTIDNFSAGKYRRLQVDIPDRETQNLVADFLDAETTRIDALIAKKRRMIELLVERGVAAAHETITGVAVPGPRRPSGVGWLGSIPESWSLAAVSAHFTVQLGRMLNPERARGVDTVPYARNINVRWDHVDMGDVAQMTFPPEDRPRYRLHPGDLLVNEGGAGVGRTAVWRDELEECYFQKSVLRLRPLKDAEPQWLLECMRVAVDRAVPLVEGNLATIPHLPAEALRAYRFPFPDSDTQRALLDRLHDARDRDRMLRRKLDRQIELLTERRQALITSAVTGMLAI